jgi:hypothetical protein
MKKSLLLTYFLTFLPCFGFGQKIDTIYYDKHWNPVTSKKYKYYRIARQDSNCVRVFDYFKSGKIQMSGGYKSFDLIEQTGPFYYYKRNRIYNLDVYELSKYPDILAKYKGVLDNFPMQPDSLVLSIFFFNNNKVKSLYFRHKCCTLDGPRLDFLKNGD